MGRILLAFRAFFSALSGGLTDESFATAVQATDSDSKPLPAASAETSKPAVKPKAPKSRRSEALTLLAALQREARFVDLVMEPLDEYSDEQIGAAARDVLRDSRATLQRIFDLKPVVDTPEGESFTTPAEFSTGRFRVVGDVSGSPPYQGELVHPGWASSQVKLPEWTGDQEAEAVVAPAEIQI